MMEWKSVGMMKFPTEWKNKKCPKPPASNCSTVDLNFISFRILQITHQNWSSVIWINHKTFYSPESLAHHGDDSSFTMAIIQLRQHVRSRSNSFRLISDDRKYSDRRRNVVLLCWRLYVVGISHHGLWQCSIYWVVYPPKRIKQL